jgi:hypothetical protein
MNEAGELETVPGFCSVVPGETEPEKPAVAVIKPKRTTTGRARAPKIEPGFCSVVPGELEQKKPANIKGELAL